MSTWNGKSVRIGAPRVAHPARHSDEAMQVCCPYDSWGTLTLPITRARYTPSMPSHPGTPADPDRPRAIQGLSMSLHSKTECHLEEPRTAVHSFRCNIVAIVNKSRGLFTRLCGKVLA